DGCKLLQGEQPRAAAARERPPLFVRASLAIAVWPKRRVELQDGQRADEHPVVRRSCETCRELVVGRVDEIAVVPPSPDLRNQVAPVQHRRRRQRRLSQRGPGGLQPANVAAGRTKRFVSAASNT